MGLLTGALAIVKGHPKPIPRAFLVIMHWTARYINIPYINKGREFSGADCWGLVRLVYKNELGIDLPTYGEVSADNLAKVPVSYTHLTLPTNREV